MKSVISVLHSFRKKKRLSQKELGERLGIPQSHLSRLESGKTDVTLSKLQQWASALDAEIVVVPKKWLSAVHAMTTETSKDRAPLWQPDEGDRDV